MPTRQRRASVSAPCVCQTSYWAGFCARCRGRLVPPAVIGPVILSPGLGRKRSREHVGGRPPSASPRRSAPPQAVRFVARRAERHGGCSNPPAGVQHPSRPTGTRYRPPRLRQPHWHRAPRVASVRHRSRSLWRHRLHVSAPCCITIGCHRQPNHARKQSMIVVMNNRTCDFLVRVYTTTVQPE